MGRDGERLDDVVGANIRACRHARGLSPDELNERMRELGASMTPRVLQSIESGNRPARIADLLALAAVLRVHPVKFLLPRFHTVAAIDINGISLDSDVVGRWLAELEPDRDDPVLVDRSEPCLKDLGRLATPPKHEQRLRQVINDYCEVECSDAAVLRTDLDGTIVDWSWGAERMFGWSADEATGQSVSILSMAGAPEDHTQAVFESVARTREPAFFSDYSRCKSGVAVYARIGVAPICEPGGDELRGFVGAAIETQLPIDVDEIAKMAPKSQAIVGVDAEGIIRYWGGAAEDIYGWSASEVVGHRFSIMTGDVPDTEFLERVDTVLRAGCMSMEGRRPTKSGRRVDVHIEMTAIHDADGEVIGVLHLSHLLRPDGGTT